MPGCPCPAFSLAMVADIVQHEIQGAAASIASAEPARKLRNSTRSCGGEDPDNDQSSYHTLPTCPHTAVAVVVAGAFHPLPGPINTPASRWVEGRIHQHRLLAPGGGACTTSNARYLGQIQVVESFQSWCAHRTLRSCRIS
jgi:hypothetical protein